MQVKFGKNSVGRRRQLAIPPPENARPTNKSSSSAGSPRPLSVRLLAGVANGRLAGSMCIVAQPASAIGIRIACSFTVSLISEAQVAKPYRILHVGAACFLSQNGENTRNTKSKPDKTCGYSPSFAAAPLRTSARRSCSSKPLITFQRQQNFHSVIADLWVA